MAAFFHVSDNQKRAVTSFFTQARELVPNATLKSAQYINDQSGSVIRLIVNLPEDTPITSDNAYSLHDLAAAVSDREQQEIVVSFVPLVAEGEDIDLSFLGTEFLQGTQPVRLRSIDFPKQKRTYEQKTLLIGLLIAFVAGSFLSLANQPHNLATNPDASDLSDRLIARRYLEKFLAEYRVQHSLGGQTNTSNIDPKEIEDTLKLLQDEPN